MLDILIIHPENQKAVYQNLANEYTAIESPIWSGLIATYIRNTGFSVKIYDTAITPFDIKYIDENRCKFIVIPVYGHQPSASTQNMTYATQIIKEIKTFDSSIKILILGNHASALPERTLIESTADFVAIGEGVRTICDLLNNVEYNKCRGLLTYADKFIYGPVAENLSENELNTDMPEIAWDLLDMSKYRAHNWHCFGFLDKRTPYAAIYTSLGCQFSCNFCMIHSIFNEHKIRLWSVENIIKQIDKLYNEYGVRNIKIADEMFMMYKKQVHAICDALIEKNYKDLNIWAYARIDTVREDYLPKLKKAGIRWLALGIESGDEYVRDGADKHFTANDIKHVVKNLQNAGVMVVGNYIFGLPHDTIKTMQDTLDLAIELNTEMLNFYCAKAYPGSELYEMTVSDNADLTNSWENYSEYAYGIIALKTSSLEASDIVKFRDNAFNAYFKNPIYLNMIEEKFGVETRIHIEKMTSQVLKRKIYT